MSNTKRIYVRFTDDQYKEIKNKACFHGFKSLSTYIRLKILKINFQTLKRLIEIHKRLLQEENEWD